MTKKQKFIKAAELAALWEECEGRNKCVDCGEQLRYAEFFGECPRAVRGLFLDCFEQFRVEAYQNTMLWSIPELPSLLMSEAYAE